ncbi:MAG TPA: adenylate/guanylate cyclase domain-containing protein [Solirubrobacteraceae bacterium]|nr:adenylate/guanylate cyclase domain-containing protein [Solirubrobacteraceae bacterium]
MSAGNGLAALDTIEALAEGHGMREMDLGPVLDSTRCQKLSVRRATRSPQRRDVQTALSLLEESLTRDHPTTAQVDRVLATVLFTDIVDSTARAAAMGDSAWRQVLDRHDRISQSVVAGCGGHLVKRTGDGVLATFGAPLRGLHCAKALRTALSFEGIAIRVGVHTGEVELRGDDVAGIGVHIAARVAALAGSGELLASRTVKDLVAGSGYTFASRGVHSLKGVPEQWELLAVT